MAAGFLSVLVYTDDSEGSNENFTWERDGDDVTVRGYGDLVYDSGWNGLKNLTVIPDGGVVSFSDGMFMEHTSLETVTVQGSVGTLGHNALSFCDTLTTLTIWGSVDYVGDAVIFSCDSLTTITIAGTIGSVYNNTALWISSLKTVNLGCTMDISPGDTDYGGIAREADVVNKIHSYSASYDWADDGSSCTVNIACSHGDTENHQEHPEVAHTVKIPPTESKMGTTTYSVSGTYDGFAYSDTKDVKDIPAPNQCGDNLYWSMDSDKCVTFTGSGDMWDYTPDMERGWKACSSVILPDGLTYIGKYAFEDCTNLASVTIPDSVTSIGNVAFNYCTSLASVTIPDSVTSIGERAFEYCTLLVSVTIPDSVTSIGEYAFYCCTLLVSVTIPDSVTSIGTEAFYLCENLAEVNVACPNPLNITAEDTSNGYVAYYASNVNLYHTYSATYTWADDGSACTVRVFCEDCDYLADIEHPAVSSVVKIPATETEMGTTEYSVSGTVEGYQYSSVKDIQDIPPTGKPGGSNDNTLLYIAAGGAITAIALIGGAFFLLRKR
jgi:hypothetical protein